MKKNIIVVLLIFLTHATMLLAQKTDVELWTGGALNFKLHKRFSAQVEQVIRFNDTISHFKNAYTEGGLKFKISKFIAIAGNYRYIENPPTKNAQRYSGDFFVNLGKKEFPLSLQYRMRYQHEVRISNKKVEDFIRNKFTLNYNLCKLVDPYFAFEPFFQLNGKNEFRVIRYAIGLDWKLIENLQLTSFYMLQKDVNIKKPDKSHIIGLMLSYDLRTYKKQSKTIPSTQ